MRHSGFFSQLSIDMHTCISRVSNNFFRFNYFGSRKGSGSWDKHFATLTPFVNFVLNLGKKEVLTLKKKFGYFFHIVKLGPPDPAN